MAMVKLEQTINAGTAMDTNVAGHGCIERKLGNWCAYYFFYHADRNQLLRYLVSPLTQELLQNGIIDRFYFVQYNLGGPHVRIRWRLTCRERALEAEAILAERASGFLSRLASPTPVTDERIHAMNRSLLGVDPAVTPEDDQVYPDNSYRRFPIDFEIERYGGMAKFECSLDFFALSSIHILCLLAKHRESNNWMRSAMLRMMLQLAWGLSAGRPDLFVDLAGYGVKLMGGNFAPCLDQAGQVYAQRSPELMDRIGREMDAIAGIAGNSSDDELLAAGSCQLAAHLKGLVTSRHWSIAASHIHMTANRLGVSNAEEVYLSQMLWLTVNALRTEMPGKWRQWWGGRFSRRRTQCGSLEGVVTSALTEFANHGA